MRMYRTWGTVAAATLLVTTAACGGGSGSDGSDGSEDGSDAVTAGVIPIVDVAPIYLGVDQGFFEDEGIDLTLELAQGGAAIVPGVESGQFEFGFSNITSLLTAASQGLPLKMVAAGAASTGEVGSDFSAVVVPEDSDIQDASDLEGRTVAVNTLNNIGTTTINQAVREAGGDPSSIEYTELGFPDMPAAVAEGQVDAAWVVEPFVTITAEQGARQVVSNFAETAPDLMVATYFTSGRTAEEDPDLVERFAAAMKESNQYAQDNPDEVRRIIQTYTELSPEAAEAITLPSFPADINEDSINLLGELGVEDGIFEEQPDTSTLLP